MQSNSPRSRAYGILKEMFVTSSPVLITPTLGLQQIGTSRTPSIPISPNACNCSTLRNDHRVRFDFVWWVNESCHILSFLDELTVFQLFGSCGSIEEVISDILKFKIGGI
jgi:hypothetical protein